MFELPDKRALLIISLLILVGAANIFVSSTSPFAASLEVLLYLTFIGAGLAFAVLDLRHGYCLNRPSITRDEAPALFWLEFLVSCGFVVFGTYKLWLLL